MKMISPESHVHGLRHLSPRETQLVLYACAGLTDKEIATRLQISRGTVVTLWSKLRAKLSIASRTIAVAAMASGVSRLGAAIPAFSRMPGEEGDCPGIRILASRKQIVLSCSTQAQTLFGIVPGVSLSSWLDAGSMFLNSDGLPLREVELPWMRSLMGDSKAVGVEVVVVHQHVKRRFQIDCHSYDDPTLDRVVVIDFHMPPLRQALVQELQGLAQLS